MSEGLSYCLINTRAARAFLKEATCDMRGPLECRTRLRPRERVSYFWRSYIHLALCQGTLEVVLRSR
jgi:hypothetical protein